MQERTKPTFASRKDVEQGFRYKGALALLFAATLCAMLSACAEDPKYPSLSKITDLENVLTPEQRQKAVADLKKDEQNHTSDATKAIERPN